MCGILGWVARDLVPDAFDVPLEILGHRGPDGRKTWRAPDGRALFGHLRLAILDPTPRGAQPTVAAGGRSVFLQNGEIYNFRELRARMEAKRERFDSEADTEVAHRWLDARGPAGLEDLEGMFALALWWQRERRLLLARDRLGVKPLYYARLPGALVFASTAQGPAGPPPDLRSPGPRSSFRLPRLWICPVRSLPLRGNPKAAPAHALLYEPDSGRLDIRAYWRLERREVRDDPEELRERIGQAVSSHMVSDVPVGAFLSGGLDSSTVVALACRENPEIPTFAVGYGDGDPSDIVYARIASNAFDTRHHEEYPKMPGLETALARSAETYDEPFYDPRALAMLDLARAARRLVKVVLSGDGGDEVFGGYGWHETVMRYESLRAAWRPLEGLFARLWRGFIRPIAEHPRAARLAGSARLLASDFPERYFAVRGFFTGPEQRRVLGRGPEDAARLFRQFDRPDLPIIHRLMWLDLHTYLPDNGLALVDRSTMSVGLEARVPLLDRQLVEYAFSLPPPSLLRPGATKVAFRKAVEPWVPEAIRARPKSGFSPPFKRWIGGPARDSALRILERGSLARDGVIDPAAVRTLVEGGAQRRHNKLWLLLSLEAWYVRWIARAARGGLEEAPRMPALAP